MSQLFLYLENGKTWTPRSFGHTPDKPLVGEMVFNTSMSGYQEILTDPSYCDQFLVMTTPLIGNYGIQAEDFESLKIWPRVLIVHEAQHVPSHFGMSGTLGDFLKEQNVIGLDQIDTRTLTKTIRDHGVMKAVISPVELNADELRSFFNQKLPTDQIKRVTCSNPIMFPGEKERIVLMDFGYKQHILKSLLKRQCQVVVVPAFTSASAILRHRPQGIVLSNGPGDPKDVHEAFPVIMDLQEKLPLFGICMGHQLLALANGADTYKLPFGHRGGNHPVKDLTTGKIFMTSQNHGYAVKTESLKGTSLELTQINLNDETVEGLRHKNRPVFSVQYHPEAHPGPEDTMFLFDEFLESVRSHA
jgi:carbamoyl-phosphate synthase small subunit